MRTEGTRGGRKREVQGMATQERSDQEVKYLTGEKEKERILMTLVENFSLSLFLITKIK